MSGQNFDTHLTQMPAFGRFDPSIAGPTTKSP